MTEPLISSWPSLENVNFQIDRWTQPFWDAAREHKLVIQRCSDCSRMRMPPSPFCPHCRSQECDWPQLAGEGTIYTFTVVPIGKGDQPGGPAPFVPALIEFPDAPGVRLISAIVDALIEDIQIGAPVTPAWQERQGEYTVPRFRLR